MPTETPTPLLMEFSTDLVVLRGILESALGRLPALEPMSSVSALTPDILAAPFDNGLHLPFAEELGSHHYLEQLRATAALYLEAKRREAIERRRLLAGHGPCLDPADHDWVLAADGGPGILSVFQQCAHEGCYAIREVPA